MTVWALMALQLLPRLAWLVLMYVCTPQASVDVDASSLASHTGLPCFDL